MHQKLAINFDDCKPVNITSIVVNVRNKYKKVNNMDANVLNIAMNNSKSIRLCNIDSNVKNRSAHLFTVTVKK